MSDSHVFAIDVFRTVCDWLAIKAADLQLMVESGSSFEEWLAWEAFLACKARQPDYPFCEVAAKPAYASEGVGDQGGDLGDLRVGGSFDAEDHRWVFAEFALLHDGNRADDHWRRQIEADSAKLLRLGWRRSASLLVVLVASNGDVLTERADDLANLEAWNQPALTDPFNFAIPGGGSLVAKAFDIKRDRAHTLAGTNR